MRMPKALKDALTDEGQEAWKHATDRLGDSAPDFVESIERYAYAVDTAARLRAEWIELGRPTLTDGGGGRTFKHPMPGMIAEADLQAHRFANALGLNPDTGKRPGRPPGATSAKDRVAAASRPGLKLAKGPEDG